MKNDKGDIVEEDVIVNELPKDLDMDNMTSHVFEEDIN